MNFFEFFIINWIYNLIFFLKFYCFIFCEYFNTSICFYISFKGFSWYYSQVVYFFFNWLNILNEIIVDYRHDLFHYWEKITWDYYILYREWIRPVSSSELSSDTISTYWVGYSLGVKYIFAFVYIFFDTLLFLLCDGIMYFYKNFLIFWNWFYYLMFFESMLIFTEPFNFPNHIIAVLIKFFFLASVFWLPAFWWSRGVEIDYWDMYVPPKIQKFYKRFISWGSKKKRRFVIFEPFSRMMGFFKTAPLPTVDVLKDILLYLKYLAKIQALFFFKLMQFKKIYPDQFSFKILKEKNDKLWINISFEKFSLHLFFLSKTFYNRFNIFAFFSLQKFYFQFSLFFHFLTKFILYISFIRSYITSLYSLKFPYFCLFFKNFNLILFFINFFNLNNKYIKITFKFLFFNFLIWNIILSQIFYLVNRLNFQFIGFLKFCCNILNSFGVFFIFRFCYLVSTVIFKIICFLPYFMYSMCLNIINYSIKYFFKLYIPYYFNKVKRLGRYSEYKNFLFAPNALFYILTNFSLNFCNFFHKTQILTKDRIVLNYKDITNLLLNKNSYFQELYYILNLYLDFEQKLLFKFKTVFHVAQMFKPLTVMTEEMTHNIISPADKDLEDLRIDTTSGSSNNFGLDLTYGFETTSNFFYQEFESYEVLGEFIDVESNDDYTQAFHPIPYERLAYNSHFPSSVEIELEIDDDLEEGGITTKEWRHSDFFGENYKDERFETINALPDYYDRFYALKALNNEDYILPYIDMTRNNFEKNRETAYKSNNWEILLTLEVEDFRNFHAFSTILYTFALKYYRLPAADWVFYWEGEFYDEDEFIDWIANLLDEAANWAPAPLPNEHSGWWTEDPVFYLEKHRAIYGEVSPLRYNWSLAPFFAAFDYEHQSFFNVKDFFVEHDDWYDLGIDQMPFWITSWAFCVCFPIIIPVDDWFNIWVFGGQHLRLENVFVYFYGFGPTSRNLLSNHHFMHNLTDIISLTNFSDFFYKFDAFYLYTTDRSVFSLTFYSIYNFTWEEFCIWLNNQYPFVHFLVMGSVASRNLFWYFFDIPHLFAFKDGVSFFMNSLLFLNNSNEIYSDQYLHLHFFNVVADIRHIDYELFKYNYFLKYLTLYTRDLENFKSFTWLDVLQKMWRIEGFFETD